jgi:hypothetical protein
MIGTRGKDGQQDDVLDAGVTCCAEQVLIAAIIDGFRTATASAQESVCCGHDRAAPRDGIAQRRWIADVAHCNLRV